MAGKAFILGEDGARRVSETVRTAESGRGSQPPARRVSDSGGSWDIWLRIDSLTLDDGRYPAVLLMYDAAADEWSDGADAWAVTPNGETLEEDVRYLARLNGAANGLAVFVVTVGGGTPAAFSGAKVASSASQTVSTYSSFLTILFDYEFFDIGNYHSTTTNKGRLTVPESGQYLAGCAITLFFNTSDLPTVLFLRLICSNASEKTVDAQFVVTDASLLGNVVLTVSEIFNVTAGDYFTVVVSATDGPVTISNQPGYASFWCYKIGGSQTAVIDELVDEINGGTF